ncbi:hypothetical protein LRP88_00838 [Fusarium phalaenopsidis]|nr:hypothetical protein NCS56_00876900 [Fusarium sp. Ph1]
MTSPHPSVAVLSTANESLAPVLPILNAFAHRHRNQHHSSHWWSSFSLVRRAARNLSTDLTSRPRPIKNKNKPGNVEGDNHPALARAKWMIRHVVPRTYIAFSQLAADNQHAPLGLLLLSVLARINRILSDLVPADQNAIPTSSASASAKPTTTGTILSSNSQTSTPAETDSPDIDMGVTISRNEVLPIRKTITSQPETKPDAYLTEPPSKERKLKSLTKDTKRSSSKDSAKDKPKKKKKKGGDALSSLFGSL